MIQNEIEKVLSNGEDIYSQYDEIEAILNKHLDSEVGGADFTIELVNGEKCQIKSYKYEYTFFYKGTRIETCNIIDAVLMTGFIA